MLNLWTSKEENREDLERATRLCQEAVEATLNFCERSFWKKEGYKKLELELATDLWNLMIITSNYFMKYCEACMKELENE